MFASELARLGAARPHRRAPRGGPRRAAALRRTGAGQRHPGRRRADPRRAGGRGRHPRQRRLPRRPRLPGLRRRAARASVPTSPGSPTPTRSSTTDVVRSSRAAGGPRSRPRASTISRGPSVVVTSWRPDAGVRQPLPGHLALDERAGRGDRRPSARSRPRRPAGRPSLDQRASGDRRTPSGAAARARRPPRTDVISVIQSGTAASLAHPGARLGSPAMTANNDCRRRRRTDGLRHRPGRRRRRARRRAARRHRRGARHAAAAGDREVAATGSWPRASSTQATPTPRSAGSPRPPTWTRSATADVVVEAVFEKLEVKHEVFRALDRICRDGAVLATNTCAIPITQIAAVTERPEARRRHPLLLAGADDGAVRAGARLQDQRRDAGRRAGVRRVGRQDLRRGQPGRRRLRHHPADLRAGDGGGPAGRDRASPPPRTSTPPAGSASATRWARWPPTDLTGVDILRNATHEHLHRHRRTRSSSRPESLSPDGRRRRPRPQDRPGLLHLRHLAAGPPSSPSRHTSADQSQRQASHAAAHRVDAGRPAWHSHRVTGVTAWPYGSQSRPTCEHGPAAQPGRCSRVLTVEGVARWSSSVAIGCEIALTGRLDVQRGRRRPAGLHAAIDAGTGDLVVDCPASRSSTPPGSGVLLGADRRAKLPGRRLVLRDAAPRVLPDPARHRLHRVLHPRRVPVAAAGLSHGPPGQPQVRPVGSRRRAGPALGDADVRRPLLGGRVQRALPAQPGQGPDRPLGRLRPADPDRLRPRPRAGPRRGRQGRRPGRHLGDMRALFDGIPLAEMNTSMTINATAMWLLALYEVRRRGAGGAEPAATCAELGGTTQNDIVKEYLSRGTYVFPPAASLRLTTDLIAYTVDARAAVEPDQHLQLPPAGGRRDAGAGARVRAVARRSRCSTRCATPVRCRRSGSATWSRGSRSSSTPGCGSSRRCARCAPSSQLWDELTRDRYGVTDAKAAPVPVRRAGQLARPHRGAAGEQRAAHRAGDARASRCPRTPGPARCSCRPGTRRSACRGRGTSSGRCGCSRCSPTSPTCSSTTTCSPARTSSRPRSTSCAPRARAEMARIAGDGRRGRGRRERLPEVRSWSPRTPRAGRGSSPARRSSSASTASPRPSRAR